MARVAWANPVSGISGDMCLGAMVDLGADPNELESAIRSLNCSGDFELTFDKVARSTVQATHANVKVSGFQIHRTLGEVKSAIMSSSLTPKQKEQAIAVFVSLAEVEGSIHGMDPNEVQLHEVGSVDAMVDICGFVVARDLLRIEEFFFSPPALGGGIARTDHGILAVPAPAVASLLTGKVVYGGVPDFEATTPTGAALMAGFGTMVRNIPEMEIVRVGYGAGSKDRGSFPNVLQVVLGETAERNRSQPKIPGRFEDVVELETNVDDVTGELAGFLISQLMNVGALDAFLTPEVAKKGRPGLLLTSVVLPQDVARVSEEIFSITGTLGIRSVSKRRYVLDRTFFEIELMGSRISVKSGPFRCKAEFDELVQLSLRTGVPLLRLERMAQVEIEKHLAAGTAKLENGMQ